MKICLLFIISLLNFSVYAQQWDWARTADTTTAVQRTQPTNANKICCDNFGNVFSLGSNNGKATFGNTLLDSGSFVVKYDSLGNFQWAKHIDNYGRDIATDEYGNLYVLDDFYNPAVAYNIYKFNSSGILIWEKSFTGWALSFAVSNGSIYVTGSNSGFFLTKINSNGIVDWLSQGLTDCSTGCYGGGRLLCIDKNKTIYVVGNGAYANCMYCSGWFLAKYDTLGNIVYSNFKWDEYADNFELAVDDSLNIYTMYCTGGHYFTGYDLAKYDSLLNPIWINSYSAYGLYYFSQGLSIDKNGNIFIGGGVSSNSQNVDSVLVYSQWIQVKGYIDAAVLKLNPSGNFVWVKTAGGKGYESSSDLCIDKFGNCYVAGNLNSGGGLQNDTVSFYTDTVIINPGWGQIFVSKLNLGNTTTGVGAFANSNINFFVFPNPSSGIFTVDLRNCRDAKICVYDMLGSCLLNKVCRNDVNPKIDLSCQPKGIYFMEIVSDGERAVKKIVLE